MTSNASILRRATPLMLARFVSACVTVAIPLVLARTLELADYGTYKQFFLVAVTLTHVLPFGMAQSLYFFLPRAEDRRPYLGQTLIWLAVIGSLAGALLLAGAGALSEAMNNPGLWAHRWELALYTALSVASFPLEQAMTSQGQVRRAAATYLVSDTLRAASLILPVRLGFGLTGAITAMVALAAARTVAAWALLLGTGRGPVFDRRLFATQLWYAAPFGAAMLLNMPQQHVHQFAVSAVVAPATFAVYAAGCFQLPLVDLLYTPTSEVLMVRLGELERQGRPEEGIASFRDAASKLAYAFLPLCAFLLAAAPELIAAMFGARFLAAVPIFRVSILGIPLATLPMDGTLRARGHTRHIFASYLVKAAVTVPLVLLLVRSFGMIGGIASWLLAEVVGKAVLFARIPAALSTPSRRASFVDVVPWSDFGRASVAAAAAALAVAAGRWASSDVVARLPGTFAWRLFPLCASGVVFIAGYLLVLRVFGVRIEAALAARFRRSYLRSVGRAVK